MAQAGTADQKWHTIVLDREDYDRLVRIARSRGTKPGTTSRWLLKQAMERFEGLSREERERELVTA
jgi:hypothetical protein